MKKWTRIVTLVLAVAVASAVLVFASGESTLISLSYLNGTYASQMTSILEDMADELQQVYDAALEKLSQETGKDADESWTSSTAFETVYPEAGETVTLSAGSGLVWYSGSGTASAMLVDVTAGTELSAGSALTVGHRYLAEQETVITASASASCGAEGLWKTTATGTAPIQLPFVDVLEGAWYYDAVTYVVENGLFNGISATTFEPNANMSRAMLVTVLHRLAGEPSATGSSGFTDVQAGTWYASAVLWGAKTGIVAGTSPTTFTPNDNVPREQIAVLLYRYAGYYGCDVSDKASVSGFPDNDKISDYAQEAISWAVAVGVLQGADGMLNPVNGATRAEVATMLQRFAQWLENQ